MVQGMQRIVSQRHSRPSLLKVDRSAWISFGCFFTGIYMCGPMPFVQDMDQGGLRLVGVAASLVLFFMLVLLIQRHMHIQLTATTFGAPKRLVTQGPFRFTRNPIYVAYFLPLASVALFSPWSAVAAGLLYILLMTQFVIRREERELQHRFGMRFTAYAARVPRWLF